jgi:secreted trypsin-like serine protease
MDGGSPLACQKDTDHYELAGLVTFGTSCSQDQTPSLYTNVSKFSQWIKQNYEAMKKRRNVDDDDHQKNN